MTLKTRSSQIHPTVVQIKPLLSISLVISPVLSASSAVAGFCRCWCLDEPSLLFDHFLASTPPPLAHTYTHTKRQIQTHKLSKRDLFKSNQHGTSGSVILVILCQILLQRVFWSHWSSCEGGRWVVYHFLAAPHRPPVKITPARVDYQINNSSAPFSIIYFEKRVKNAKMADWHT